MYQEYRVCCWNFEGLSYLAFYSFIQLAMVLAREALTKWASKKEPEKGEPVNMLLFFFFGCI